MRLFKSDHPSNPVRISAEECGITLTTTDNDGERAICQLSWGDICQAIAYKRDCFGFDLICLAIGGSEGTVEVTEEMKGWDDFLEQAPIYLPGWQSKAELYDKVMLPPFAENRTVIFARSDR